MTIDRKQAGNVGAERTSAIDPRRAPAVGPGKQTLVEQVYGVQMRQDGQAATPASGEAIKSAAAGGVSGAGGPLPHLGRIQSAFGAGHDVSGVRAHVGGNAAEACDTIGAIGYAAGAHVAFREQPDLHTAAHEAAHVVQQSAGVRLKGGVGEAGDAHERHADAVADLVVRGESAAGLLSDHGASSGPSSAPAASAVQRKVKPEDVSSEMIGQTFELSAPFTSGATTLKAGDKVKVLAWDNAKATASVEFTPPAAGAAVRLEVPKKVLHTTHATVTGVNAYSAGVAGQEAAVEAAEHKLDDWTAKEAEYKKAGTTKLWTAEKARL